MHLVGTTLTLDVEYINDMRLPPDTVCTNDELGIVVDVIEQKWLNYSKNITSTCVVSGHSMYD